MQDLQRLQPEIKSIQERYKDDQQRMNQEMMKLLPGAQGQSAGLLPPAPASAPVLHLALLPAAQRRVQARTIARAPEPFLFIAGPRRAATGASSSVADRPLRRHPARSSLVTDGQRGQEAAPDHVALPFVFVVFIINFPAGLIVYWITTNVWTIGQQLLVAQAVPEARADRRRRPRRGARRPAARQGAGDGGRRASRRRKGGEGRRRTAAGRRRRRPRRARRRSARAARRYAMAGEDPRAQAEGATVGEAKWAASRSSSAATPA